MKVTGYIEGTLYEADILEKNGKQKCPICPQVGKKNNNDTPLSVSLSKKLFKCHKCGWSGGYGEDNDRPLYQEKVYKIPDIKNHTELSDPHLQHFSKRMITQNVLIRNKVSSCKNNWFAFTYYDGETPVKVKYKTPPDKDGKKRLMQSPESKPWIYKYNDLVGKSEVMVCEGEEEALIWEVAGFNEACSVDMGAPNKADKNVDLKLQCITNCFDVFEEAETIYLSVDMDDNGRRLQKELIRMFGSEKCKLVDFSPCKDANEYALKFGIKKLLDLKNEAKDVKIEGIFNASDFYKEMESDFLNGQPKGTTTYFSGLDDHFTWRMGEVNVWTGYNNEGKSLALKQLLIAKSLGDNWKHAFFSPEEIPLNEWYTDIIESFIGKSADKTQDSFNNYMTKREFIEGYEFANNFFFNILPDEDHSLDELFKRFSYVVRKFNIKTITIDPYNQVHHKMEYGEREDLYISKFMSKLKQFALKHYVSVNLIAHQSTPIVHKEENYPEPNIYKIKGGGTFADKADNVLIVWRENRNTNKSDTTVIIGSQKIKKQKLTGIPGTTTFNYDRRKNRYRDHRNFDPIDVLKAKIIELSKGTQESINFYEKEEIDNFDSEFFFEREAKF